MHTNFDNIIDRTIANPVWASPLTRFLVAHGTRASGASLPAGIVRGRMGDCFCNAWNTTVDYDLQYWEGYAWDLECGEFPFYHAWCVDITRGAVVDPTWRAEDRARYLGVHVPRDRLFDILLASGTYGVLDKGRGFEHEIVAEHWHWRDSA